MSQIESYKPAPGDVAEIKSQHLTRAMTAINQEVEVIKEAAIVVPVLIDGGMVPDIYLPTHSPRKGAPAQGRDKAIAKGMAAAVFGASLGFGVAKSLQNVFTVHGMPSIYARTAVALVLSHGHEVWTEEESPQSVTVAGRRRGSEKVEPSTWTIQRAEQAGFTSNPKYKTQPQEMLYAKAAMAVCRRLAPDVLEGIPMSVEELELERPVQAVATRMDSPGRGASGLAAALASAPDAPTSPDTPAAPDAEPQAELVDADGDADFIADVTNTLAGLDSTDAVKAFATELGTDLPQEAKDAINARWHELNEETK